jgi:CRISPR-associated protein Csm2
MAPQSHQPGRPNPQRREETPRQQADSGWRNSIRFASPLNPELFNNIAKQAAQAVSAADRNRNKVTQLRRFYDELVLWEMRTAQHPGKFDEYLPFIRMLNAKAAYAEGRKLVDRTFVDLLAQTLRETTSAETFATCKLFWEAFMGFYKQERGND